MLEDLIVTTSFRENAAQVRRAMDLALRFGLTYRERKKLGLAQVIGKSQGALVVYKEKLIFVGRDGSQFAFHPDTAMLRIKSKHDPLLELIGTSPKRVLDATMGMANDSLVMAHAGHEVTGLEVSPITHLIVSQGLATYQSKHEGLNPVMRRIKTHCIDSLAYLRQQADKTYDIIYFDPMFSKQLDSSPDFAGLRALADFSPLTGELVAEAKRVARDSLIIKAHYQDPVFDTFGFERQVRPNTAFHYGVMQLEQ